MSAEILCRAAAKIRETAEGAHPGPWLHEPEAGDLEILGPKREVLVTAVRPALGWTARGDNLYKGPNGREYTADHIALWSPDVAELVASLLDGAVVRYAHLTTDDVGMRAYGLDPEQAEKALHPEFALARRILGEDA